MMAIFVLTTVVAVSAKKYGFCPPLKFFFPQRTIFRNFIVSLHSNLINIER